MVFGGVLALDSDGRVTQVIEHRKGLGGMALDEVDRLVVSGRKFASKPFDGGDTVSVLDRNGNPPFFNSAQK